MRIKPSHLHSTCRNIRLVYLIIVFLLPFIQVSGSTATEPYSFFVSGYPAKNECSSKESSKTGLTSGTLAFSSAAKSIEARFRTVRSSLGTSLRSDKFSYFGIVIR